MYCSFALAGHRGTCLRPLHIFALLAFLLFTFRHGQRAAYRTAISAAQTCWCLTSLNIAQMISDMIRLPCFYIVY